nr:MAG TPA: hypothetical protein [Caudoviricetes sp.]
MDLLTKFPHTILLIIGCVNVALMKLIKLLRH